MTSSDFLVDTNVAIWFAQGDPRARRLLESAEADPASTVSVSVASWIEVAIKHGQGKLGVDVATVRAALVANGFLELPIITGHASALERLPLHHRDPFDRLLIAQAQAEELTLVTTDKMIGRYRDVVSLRGV